MSARTNDLSDRELPISHCFIKEIEDPITSLAKTETEEPHLPTDRILNIDPRFVKLKIEIEEF